MTNQQIATTFERVADLLEDQGASPFRVRAWRDAAGAIRDHDGALADVLRAHGRAGLEAIPRVGHRLASVIIEMLETGRCSALARLEGAAAHRLAVVPGLGPHLAERIHDALGIDSLEELEVAAHDGRLAGVPGMGPRRIAAVRAVLATMLARRPRPAQVSAARPSVELLLDVDRAYREAAAAGRLRRIAPRRFNPAHRAWLPIMHLERAGWHFTAMYSNTERAHRLGRTTDWVVIYFHADDGPEARATVVTEARGAQRGRRVVRGRERECAAIADGEPEPLRQTG